MRRCLTLAVAICLILSVKFDVAEGERWSRQVSNSEWIPLANPRATQAQVEQSSPATGLLATGNAQLPQLPQLSLPPALQQQYQEQLLQLQKTQENIQKLLLLQQQLRAQQQLLQVTTFLSVGSNATGFRQFDIFYLKRVNLDEIFIFLDLFQVDQKKKKKKNEETSEDQTSVFNFILQFNLC